MKIVLAGNDAPGYAVLLHALGYPYRLCSYLYLRDGARERDTVLPCSKDGSEWIMDSGLFTFMFGSRKGELTTYEQYRDYAVRYLEQLDEWGWGHAAVECDVQRVLGVGQCERLRNEVMRPSGREIVYVWHVPEGEDGLASLAKREKRLALSVPELRQVLGTGIAGGLRVQQALVHLLSIIRANNPTARVHLLGNTERALLALPADSADSTSWLSGRYGGGFYFDPKTRAFAEASIYSPKWRAWRTWCEKAYAQSFDLLRSVLTEQQYAYYGHAACSAIAFQLHMDALNGESNALQPPKALVVSAVREEEPK